MVNIFRSAVGGVTQTQIINYLKSEQNYSEFEAKKYLNSFNFNQAPEHIDYTYFYNILNYISNFNSNFKKYPFKHTQLYTLNNFLSVTDCCTLIEAIRVTAQPSTVADKEDKGVQSKTRISQTADLSCLPLEYLNSLDQKICGTLGLPTNLGELNQAQMYKTGEFYKPHFDFFRPDRKLYDTYTSWMGQRTWTFMVYLNDVQIGGETHFPRIGLKIKPKQGMAVIWNNLTKQGRPNYKTLHEALPPKSNTKYVLTKWFRSWPLVSDSLPLVSNFKMFDFINKISD